MSDAKPSRIKGALRTVGEFVAVPLRAADFILGVPHSTQDANTVRELERLGAMHRRGELTDDEYRLAKERVLGGAQQ